MDENTFKRCISDLEDHCQKKLKDPRFYWEELSTIPGDAFFQICRGWIRDHAPTPGNFPTITNLQEAWQMWLKSHPDRKEIIRWEFCRYCEEDTPGVIIVRIPLEKPIYQRPEANFRTTEIRCGHCQNAQHRNPTWRRMRRSEIEQSGWQIVTKERMDAGNEQMKYRSPESPVRHPGFDSLAKSLPTGDNDRDEDLPF